MAIERRPRLLKLRVQVDPLRGCQAGGASKSPGSVKFISIKNSIQLRKVYLSSGCPVDHKPVEEEQCRNACNEGRIFRRKRGETYCAHLAGLRRAPRDPSCLKKAP